MSTTLRFILAFAVAALVCACGWLSDDEGFFVDRSDDYIEARPAPPLEVPEDLSSAAILDVMKIPDLPPEGRRNTFEEEIPRPEAIFARQEEEGVRIQKLGERRWLLVSQSPAVVWPKVKQFFADNGVAIAKEDGDVGRLDTDWLAPADKETKDVVRLAIREGREAASIDGGRDRLKVLLEQGIRQRTAEVHIRYENDSLHPPVEGAFPEASDAAQVETEIIGELGAYIASNVADQSVSFVARQISTQVKAELIRTPDDQPALRLALDFNRAWALVNQSLNDAKVPITDVDRSAGRVFAQINRDILEEDEDGWFTRLITREEKGRPVQIHVAEQNRALEVRVFEEDGTTPVAVDLAEQLLLLIREYAT